MCLGWYGDKSYSRRLTVNSSQSSLSSQTDSSESSTHVTPHSPNAYTVCLGWYRDKSYTRRLTQSSGASLVNSPQSSLSSQTDSSTHVTPHSTNVYTVSRLVRRQIDRTHYDWHRAQVLHQSIHHSHHRQTLVYISSIMTVSDSVNNWSLWQMSVYTLWLGWYGDKLIVLTVVNTELRCFINQFTTVIILITDRLQRDTLLMSTMWTVKHCSRVTVHYIDNSTVQLQQTRHTSSISYLKLVRRQIVHFSWAPCEQSNIVAGSQFTTSTTAQCNYHTYIYTHEGCPINKFLCSIILLIFKIWTWPSLLRYEATMNNKQLPNLFKIEIVHKSTQKYKKIITF